MHIDWKPQKMKVNLGARTLSSSVADALEFCEGKGMPQFKGCGPTVKFIRNFDGLFDVVNSRNPSANSFKAPIRKTNYEFVKKFFNQACQYIKGLKCPEGKSILKSKRKTGFLGFLVCIDSVSGMAEDLVCGENPILKYILMYKMSQDPWSHWRMEVMEQQSYGVAVQICIQAAVDETRYHRRPRKLHSSRRYRDAE